MRINEVWVVKYVVRFIKLPISKSPPTGPGDDNLNQDVRMSSLCRELIDPISGMAKEWTPLDFCGQSVSHPISPDPLPSLCCPLSVSLPYLIQSISQISCVSPPPSISLYARRQGSCITTM